MEQHTVGRRHITLHYCINIQIQFRPKELILDRLIKKLIWTGDFHYDKPQLKNDVFCPFSADFCKISCTGIEVEVEDTLIGI